MIIIFGSIFWISWTYVQNNDLTDVTMEHAIYDDLKCLLRLSTIWWSLWREMSVLFTCAPNFRGSSLRRKCNLLPKCIESSMYDLGDNSWWKGRYESEVHWSATWRGSKVWAPQINAPAPYRHLQEQTYDKRADIQWCSLFTHTWTHHRGRLIRMYVHLATEFHSIANSCRHDTEFSQTFT